MPHLISTPSQAAPFWMSSIWAGVIKTVSTRSARTVQAFSIDEQGAEPKVVFPDLFHPLALYEWAWMVELAIIWEVGCVVGSTALIFILTLTFLKFWINIFLFHGTVIFPLFCDTTSLDYWCFYSLWQKHCVSFIIFLLKVSFVDFSISFNRQLHVWSLFHFQISQKAKKVGASKISIGGTNKRVHVKIISKWTKHNQ